MGLEDRVTVLEEKTKVIKFGNDGVTPISAPAGQTGKIFLAAVDHPECVLNLVDINPSSPSTNFIQYDWCPEAQKDLFFIPSLLALDASVITVSIGQPDRTDLTVINCWTGGGALFTLGDSETGEVFTKRGFLLKCSAATKAGLTMQATIFP